MIKYYKGYFYTTHIKPIKLKLKAHTIFNGENTKFDISIPKTKLNHKDKLLLFNFCLNKLGAPFSTPVDSHKLNEIIFKSFIKNYPSSHTFSTATIYEKIYDKYGKAYAKELITGYVFPIISSDDVTFDFYFTEHTNSFGLKLKGIFEPNILNRENFSKCGCFIVAGNIADEEDIYYYKMNLDNSHAKYQIKCLFNKNVFDKNVIIDNQSQSNFAQNSNSIIDSTKINNEKIDSINIQNNQCEQLHNPEVHKVNLEKPNFTRNKIEMFNNIKDFILLLPDEDINLLSDMTNNNFNDPNIFEYLKMPRKEKIKFLDNKDQKTHH